MTTTPAAMTTAERDLTVSEAAIDAALHHLQADGAIDRGGLADLLRDLRAQLSASQAGKDALEDELEAERNARMQANADLHASQAAATEAREALESIKQWCEAYPAAVFREPDYDKARAALEAAGMTMDGLHGSWARHLLSGIGDIARAALPPAPAEGE